DAVSQSGTLRYFGFGGGPGGGHLEGAPSAYGDDFAHATKDILGSGAMVRLDLAAVQDDGAPGGFRWSSANADALATTAARYGLRLYPNVHFTDGATCVPHVVGGKLASLMAFTRKVF